MSQIELGKMGLIETDIMQDPNPIQNEYNNVLKGSNNNCFWQSRWSGKVGLLLAILHDSAREKQRKPITKVYFVYPKLDGKMYGNGFEEQD